MNIYLIRHGRQCDTRCNVDVPLSVEGEHQAELLGERMQTWGIEKLYSSDMIRARQTAEIVNKYLQIPHQIVPAFRELNFGDMEGMDDDEIQIKFAGFKVEQDKLGQDMRYPGGESAGDLVQRAMPALIEAAKGSERKIAIVCHGVWIRAVLCHILGIDMAKWRILGVSFENASISQINYYAQKQSFTLEVFNDFAHLEPYPELLRSAWGVNEN